MSVTCAIYTRKSTEEGLEQDFNSLHAQREACEAFIASQKSEGWRLHQTHYDDGGFSGGNTDRPALTQLLADIEQKRIKVIVVYKVDRLTRSLADFAKMVERFDALGVSFVSVTQQFNTTTSMGRLTLNVLLSFAQFEREVTGERIRDKIAASKKKGLWMGGNTPVGYTPNGRTLEIHPEHAAIVQAIFSGYLKHGCVRKLKTALERAGFKTPIRTYESGRQTGGLPFTRGNLYKILSNPIYIGQIAHKGETYPGQHPAIIEQATWDAVKAQLSSNSQRREKQRSIPSDSLLAGILFDDQGHRLIPSHSQKQSKRFRYYVSEPLVTNVREEALNGIRIPANDLERIVIKQLIKWLSNDEALIDELHPPPELVHKTLTEARTLAQELETKSLAYQLIRKLVKAVSVAKDSITITLLPRSILNEDSEVTSCLIVPISIKRCGFAMRLLIEGQTAKPQADKRLIQNIARGYRWMEQLTSGEAKSVGEIAAKEGITNSHVTRMIYRACMAPEIVKSILDGTLPASLTSEMLKDILPLPINWDEQRTAVVANL
jgi:DNA invertase Pin-like site-specific DNA recombinase